MQAAQADRHLHEIALILFPEQSQFPGRRRQQVETYRLQRGAALAHRLDVGRGYADIVRKQ